ncbi:CsbD family protein [Nocardia sp. 2]|uniref:CsbD family protein n=1 Tax=Nocardia acididurans TaxID=2802282 RepID=A0ABS1MB87_9NOCA|nr:CsbD family protein [Nocardia acididurans]MBL1076448.1 CsbD family protein [Nocardia acididurans]
MCSFLSLEAAGNLTGDEALQAEGKGDQLAVGLKDAANDVKEAVGDAVDKVKKKFGT